MMLRMLLVLVAVAGLSLGGCQKKEPTAPTDTTPAVEEVEDAAEEAAPAAEEAAEEAVKE